MPKKHASRAQLIQINDKLREVLTKIPNTPLVEYRDGWSDKRIGEELGISPHSVAGARVELFGKLLNSKVTGNDPEVMKRLEVLEAQNFELRVKYHKLVTMLALNKVCDCRHLALAGMETPPGGGHSVVSAIGHGNNGSTKVIAHV